MPLYINEPGKEETSKPKISRRKNNNIWVKIKSIQGYNGKEFREIKNWFFEKKIKIDKPTKEKK